MTSPSPATAPTSITVLGSEFVHYFLIEEGGAATLVDAGLPGYRGQLEPALAERGLSLSDLRAVVLTHADPDHIGFAGELHDNHGIPVYVHSLDGERTRSGKAKKTDGSASGMLKMLAHREGRRMIGHVASNGGARAAKIADVITYEDGEELDVPGHLRVIHTPGHTDGHSALHCPAYDALFVGDALNNRDIVTGAAGPRVPPAMANTSTPQAVASLARIESLGAGTVYFGHGDPSTAGSDAVVAQALAPRRNRG